MMDDGWFDIEGGGEIPKGAQTFGSTDAERCEGCGGWFAFVLEVHRDGKRAKLFCGTPHLPTRAEAQGRVDRIRDGLLSPQQAFPATVGMMQ